MLGIIFKMVVFCVSEFFKVLIFSFFVVLIFCCPFVCMYLIIKVRNNFLRPILLQSRRKKFFDRSNFIKKAKRKRCLNHNALTFEYSEFYAIINNEMEKFEEKGNFIISEKYLSKMHLYFKNTGLVNSSDKFPLELLASFYKAVIDEPIFINKGLKKNQFGLIDRTFVENVIKATNYELSCSKEAYIEQYMNRYITTGDDVCLIICYIVEILL